MDDFISDSMAKTSRDRRNIKNQLGDTGGTDEYSIMKMENVIVEPSNIVITVDGTEVVRRRFDWTTTTQFKNGVKSSNMRWDKNILQIG